MDDLTEEAYNRRLQEGKEYLQEAKDLRQTITEHADLLNIDIMIDGIETYLDGFDYNMYVRIFFSNYSMYFEYCQAY